MSLPKTGSPAPAFTLQDNNGADVSLSDFRGKKNVLVYFYPKAMTPGCTLQAQGLRDIAAQLEGHDVVVFGISPDPVKRLAKFVERDALNFQLLSDEDHAVAGLTDTLLHLPHQHRTTAVISPVWKIRYTLLPAACLHTDC